MADPTPRTAATARERVTVDYAMVERAIRTALPADMVFAYMPHGDPFAAWAGHLFANLTALAAAASPAGVAGACCTLEASHPFHIPGHSTYLHDYRPAPAPTPSEPVARCGWRPGYRTDSCGFPEDHEIHHPERGNAGWLVHPFTPATRDE